MVLTTGTISEIKEAVKDNIIAEFTHVAFGDDDTTESSSDTALGNELETKARQEYTELSDIIIISGYLTANDQNGQNIKEVGSKDGASGDLQSRKVIDTIIKTSSKELWIDEEIKVEITQEAG